MRISAAILAGQTGEGCEMLRVEVAFLRKKWGWGRKLREKYSGFGLWTFVFELKTQILGVKLDTW